jgi:iron complex outermembrane receptor protein
MILKSIKIFGLALCLMPSLLFAQKSISGIVQNQQNEHLVGALVLNGSYNTVTLNNGFYRLDLEKGKNVIKVQYMGYQTLVFELVADENNTNEFSQNFTLNPQSFLGDEVLISSSRVSNNAPVSQKNVTKEEIEKIYRGQDGGFLLEDLSPSIVAYSESGTGLSNYADFRLRGMDQKRINLTLNGVPLNDMIDQGVFFSNFTDFGNSIQSIQIQRGVGTSSNGVSSYAGSVNFESLHLTDTTPKVELQLTGGSFNTQRWSAEASTGKMKNNFSFYSRFTQTKSDGFRNNTSTDSWSYFLSGAYFLKKHTFKFTAFNGKSRNGLAYSPVSKADIKNDPKTNYVNPNDIDDFGQFFNQLQHIYQFNTNNSIISSIYYNGAGGDWPYGYNDVNGFTQINYPLYNTHIGGLSTFNGKFKNLNYNSGVSASKFLRQNLEQVVPNFSSPYYADKTQKNEAAVFAKVNYKINKLEFLTDVQVRAVELIFDTTSFTNTNIPIRKWIFVNPKVGVSYQWNNNFQSYVSFGRTGREPTRTDILNGVSITNENINLVLDKNRVKPEFVNNFELGTRINYSNLTIQVNAFYMQFENEIAPIGTIQNAFITERRNMENSFRRGFETDYTWKIISKLQLKGQVTYMQAKISKYQPLNETIILENVTTPLSPNWNILNTLQLEVSPKLFVSLRGRYLSKSYIEPTNKADFVIPEFFVTDLHLNYQFKKHELGLQFNNITNQKYFTHGLVINPNTPGFFIQAPWHIYATLKFRF